ncbi:Abc transporter b family member [Thalictrum thalictroides]|uniref:Abc transporter b family member n=1 Tax=Thalictrum thalictroides TaxID=46969 RepID=A0A7J6VMK7_THATH|nr:Abc transporter b family member [Thalictrum thalictroides]
MSFRRPFSDFDNENKKREEDDGGKREVELVGEKEKMVVGRRGEDKKAEKKAQRISFLKLFSFADSLDYILMILGSVGACVHGAAMPVFLVFFGQLMNVIGSAHTSQGSITDKVSKYALYFVYLSVVMFFAAWIEVASWMYTGERQVAKMRLAYLAAVLNQDISQFDTESSKGEVISCITSDVLVVQDAISEKVGHFLHYISRFAVGFIVCFVKVWQITLVTISILPLMIIAGGLHVYVATGLIARVRKSYVKAGEIAEEVIGNIRTVQAFVGEEKAVDSYKTALSKTYEYGKKGGLAKGLGMGAVYFVIFGSYALLIWYTSIVVHKKIANGGDSFATVSNVIASGLALGLAAPSLPTFISATVAAYPIFEMIEKNRVKKVNTFKGRTLARVEGHIQFQNVCFSYPSRPSVTIFDKLCLNIPSGKIIALVGGSGSGKSTVISLIERFYEPLSGEVKLDGTDIRELELKWLRQQIGLVNQEPALFATSIRENILYGKDDSTMEEINRAAKHSEAISFISNLPDKYETQVGERGIQLSGGQKQRIAIARAILKNPTILLLDEATSALDAESEKSVQQALDKVMVGRTTIVVAHRLSTIKNADTIAVFQGGKIVETGTHDELLSDPNSAYSSLVHHQETASSHGQSSLGSAIGPSGSHRYSYDISQRTLSQRTTSFRSSFHSGKDTDSQYVADKDEKVRPKRVSMTRLYGLAAPDYIYGLFGILGAIGAGSQIPLFALGMTQALVAYYKQWDETQKDIRIIALLFLAGAFLNIVFYTIEHFSFGVMGERLALRVREMMFSAILKNEIGWFDESSNNSSILSSRLEADATSVKTFVVERTGTLVHNISLAILSFVIAFIFNWRITAVVLATYPLLLGGHIGEKLFMNGLGGNLSKSYLKANMLAGEAVGNIRTVAAFCSEEKVIELYFRQLKKPSEQCFIRGQIAGIFFGISQFCIYSTYGLALWYGSTLMEKGHSDFSSIMKSFFVLIITAVIMGDTLAMAPDLLKGDQMVASVFELIDRKSEVTSDIGEEVTTVEGTIELRRIKFSYPSRSDIIIFDDFNLKVRAGKSMALVGSSGSGKSSVVSLILRYYDPLAGKVMIDGKDIRKLRLKSLRKHIGLVQQEPALFATSIFENILYGKDGSSESEVIEAAKLANAHNFISSLPDGYSTKVGERGVQLSGGQKQRVAIARAVLKNPAILLLDEATSALDVESENIVQQALDRLMQNRTTLIVAHRLSTIRNADHISVLQEGKIIEQGNHSTLVQNVNGAYYKLINLQQQQQQQQY